MSRLSLYLLGPPQVELDGEPVHIGRRKAVALLAYLTMEGGGHRRDTLATLLWPERDQSRARAYLRRTLSELNRALGGGFLDIGREIVRLDPRAEKWLDVAEFQERLAACNAHGHSPTQACPDCLPLLKEAVELYRGDFLAGFTLRDSLAFDEWQFFQTEGLRDELVSVLERLVSCHGTLGEYETAIAYARRWLALDPTHEPAHRQLMALHARTGQQSAALRQYQVCEDTLAAELGIPPSAETVTLYERIRAGEDIGRELEPEFLIPRNLPPQSTLFIGRETELAELDQLIADPQTRLVTILGPGGIGKTRLALALAEGYLSAGANRDALLAPDKATPIFPDGVYFVPLAGLTAADQIVPSVAGALDFRLGGEGESRTSRQQVLDYLREKRLLLILDNFEHLLEGVELLVDTLHTAPEVQVLATSRERLHLHQEHACAIQGLDYPDWERPVDTVEYAAAQLFLNTARRIEAGFELRADDVAWLTRICRMLEGMPLGIELAAGWVDGLSIADIAAEIERGLDFLETEWRDVPARHRSMRAVFDTSWRCLSQTQRNVFAQLCVFRGGFTRMAAQEVAGADLRTLARLVDKSVLQFNRAQERYQMQELLRQYGRGRLAADPDQEHAVRDRHSAFYCAALGRWGDHLNRGDTLGLSVDFQADWANVRGAWELATRQGHVTRLDRGLDGLWHFLHSSRRFEEAAAMYQLAVDGLTARSEPLSADRKRVLVKALLYRTGGNAEMEAWELDKSAIEESRALLDDLARTDCDTRYERAWLHVMMGWELFPDTKKAMWHYEQSLELHRESGYLGQAAYRLVNIAWMLQNLGEYDEARQNLEESLTLFRALGNQSGAHTSVLFLGHLAWCTGEYGEAKRRYEEALALARAQGDRSAIADSLTQMGHLAGFLGDFQTKARHMCESATLWRVMGSRRDWSMALAWLSQAFWYCGEFGRAYEQSERSLTIAYELKASWPLLLARAFRARLDAAAGKYDAARAYAREGITLHQRCGSRQLGLLAIPQGVLGWVAVAEGDYEEAGQALRESITTIQQGIVPHEVQRITAWSLAALGRAELGLGNRVEAQQHLLEALEIVVEISAFIPLLHLMPVISVVLAEEQEPSLKERAVQLYAMAESHPFVAKAQLFEDIAGRHIRAATVGLAPQVVAAAQERGRALDWWETAEALLNELDW